MDADRAFSLLVILGVYCPKMRVGIADAAWLDGASLDSQVSSDRWGACHTFIENIVFGGPIANPVGSSHTGAVRKRPPRPQAPRGTTTHAICRSCGFVDAGFGSHPGRLLSGLRIG